MKTFIKKSLILASLTGCIASPLQAGILSSLTTFVEKNFWIVPTIGASLGLGSLYLGMGAATIARTPDVIRNHIICHNENLAFWQKEKKEINKSKKNQTNKTAKDFWETTVDVNISASKARLIKLYNELHERVSDEDINPKMYSWKNLFLTSVLLSACATAVLGPLFYTALRAIK